MFISMLFTYLHCLGARRRWWMPFWSPFLTACEQFAKNTSSSRINLFKRLFYRFILTQAKVFLPNPFERGCPHPIGCIQRYHTIGGTNSTTMVVMFVGLLCSGRWYFPYYSYRGNPMGWEFFVPAWTLIGVKLLNPLAEIFSSVSSPASSFEKYSLMLLVYSYVFGAHHQQLMPFWPPFAMAGEQFVKNKSSSSN